MFFIDVERESKVRFDPGRFMEYTDNYDPLTSKFIKDLRQEVSARSVFEVRGEEGRPDLISNQRYSDTQYWWVVALYGNKLFFDSFRVGENVSMPDIGSLEDFYFGLKAQDVTV
jgi:hypothetical protein